MNYFSLANRELCGMKAEKVKPDHLFIGVGLSVDCFLPRGWSSDLRNRRIPSPGSAATLILPFSFRNYVHPYFLAGFHPKGMCKCVRVVFKTDNFEGLFISVHLCLCLWKNHVKKYSLWWNTWCFSTYFGSVGIDCWIFCSTSGTKLFCDVIICSDSSSKVRKKAPKGLLFIGTDKKTKRILPLNRKKFTSHTIQHHSVPDTQRFSCCSLQSLHTCFLSKLSSVRLICITSCILQENHPRHHVLQCFKRTQR